MICPVCGKDKWEFERKYHTPDKYEEWCGILEPVCRAWYKCLSCGHYRARHSYNTRALEDIYADGYRSRDFRGANIKEEFMKVKQLPFEQSENKQRAQWVERFILPSHTVLDVGSGLGVFLDELRIPKKNKQCIEPNKDSAEFITKCLGVECLECFYVSGLFDHWFDWITCIHVLEHQQDPEQMLLDFKKDLQLDGKIFIEVPDASEFESLPKDHHEEFNSTHLHFFSLSSLCLLVESCGYNISDIKRVRYEQRNLERIMLVAGL